jgi:drug/metabolite transporter (DMT)-like permease
MRRVRPADWVAGLAAVVVAVLMSTPWFSGESGWSSCGWAGDVVVVLAIAGGLGIVFTIATDRAPSVQVITATGATVAAALATIITAIRVIGAAGTRFPAQGTVIALALLTVACWRSMADERTDSATSVYVPPAPRVAPPE